MPLQTRRERYESYEVYDDHGNSVGRVVLPRQQRFFGTTNGTVFLRRQPNGKPANGARTA